MVRILGWFLMYALVGVFLAIAVRHIVVPEPATAPTVTVRTTLLSEAEPVKCQFDKPIKHLSLIIHWYSSHEEMYADYLALADPVEEEDIWGWSQCIHQPEDDWAACDIYVVPPETVDANMDMDTLGHEVLHGACGEFHE